MVGWIEGGRGRLVAWRMGLIGEVMVEAFFRAFFIAAVAVDDDAGVDQGGEKGWSKRGGVRYEVRNAMPAIRDAMRVHVQQDNKD